MNKRHSFDAKCLDLAQYFYPERDAAALHELAQAIQDVVEDARPEPWCYRCGAMQPGACNCGVLADPFGPPS